MCGWLRRECLAFLRQALQHGRAVHAAFEQLDGGAAFERAVGAARFEHLAHAAAAERAHDFPFADALAGARRSGCIVIGQRLHRRGGHEVERRSERDVWRTA